MVFLTRDAIFGVNDLIKEKVTIEEWGGYVFVRRLKGSERDLFDKLTFESNGPDVQMNKDNLRARVAALTVCDNEGNRLFTDADIEALGEKAGSALDQIFAVAIRLNKFRKEDLEDLAKNSEGAPSEGSGSA